MFTAWNFQIFMTKKNSHKKTTRGLKPMSQCQQNTTWMMTQANELSTHETLINESFFALYTQSLFL